MIELLKTGSVAPDFEAQDQDGHNVKLSSFKGKPVVLYFYPKDDTPGCTAEACNFRDNTELFEKNGVKVIGVSVDSVNSHKKFHNKYGLTFTLVSDSGRKISEAYGTLNGSTDKRVSYIIDRSGKVAYVYEKVSPKEHGTEILSKLKELKLA